VHLRDGKEVRKSCRSARSVSRVRPSPCVRQVLGAARARLRAVPISPAAMIPPCLAHWLHHPLGQKAREENQRRHSTAPFDERFKNVSSSSGFDSMNSSGYDTPPAIDSERAREKGAKGRDARAEMGCIIAC
jgi:hypothetical protein